MQEHHLSVRRTARYVTCGPQDAREVWLLLHGYGQRADDVLQAAQPLDDGKRLLVAPEALSRFYTRGTSGNVGASWMTRADREREIDDYLRYLDALHDQLGTATAEQLHVLGFSQGAATACRWAAQGASSPDQLVLWGGSVPPDVDPTALRALKLVLVVGTRDKYVTDERLRQEQERLDDSGVAYRLVRFEGGHRLAAVGWRALLS